MNALACDSNEVLMELLDGGNFIPIVAIVMGCLVAMVAIIFGTLTKLGRVKAREATRREIAAYIAEGSITPQDGVELMKAARDPSEWEQIKNFTQG